MYELYHGDALEILPTLPEHTIDMVFADLPYGTTHHKWDSIIPLNILWNRLSYISKLNAAMLFTASIPFSITLGASNLPNLRYEWIWIKNRATLFQNANKMPMKKHENIMVFYRKLPTYNPQFTEGKPYKDIRNKRKRMEGFLTDADTMIKTPIFNNGIRYPTSELIIGAEVNRNHLHPTQKPVALLEYFIRTYTNAGDIILDPVMGSGTTGVAAMNTGRRFIGIEKDAGYFEIAKQRIEEAYNNRPQQ